MQTKRSRKTLSILLALLLILCLGFSALAESVDNVVTENNDPIEEIIETVEGDGGVLNEEQKEPDVPPPTTPTVPQETEKEEEKNPAPITYTVRFFDYNGGEFSQLQKIVVQGAKIEKPIFMPINYDLNFLYWYNADDADRLPFLFEDEHVMNDIILMAMYEVRESVDEELYSEFNLPNAGTNVGNNNSDLNYVNDGLPKVGTIIGDENLEGTVVDIRNEGGLVITIIDVVDGEENKDPVLGEDGEELPEEEEQEEELPEEEEELPEEEEEEEELPEEEEQEGEVPGDELPNDADLLDPVPEPEMTGTINIFSSLYEQTSISIGELVYLTATVEGYADADLTFQWQYNAGNGWVNAGATGLSYTYAVTIENVNYQWRLVVDVAQPIDIAPPTDIEQPAGIEQPVEIDPPVVEE